MEGTFPSRFDLVSPPEGSGGGCCGFPRTAQCWMFPAPDTSQRRPLQACCVGTNWGEEVGSSACSPIGRDPELFARRYLPSLSPGLCVLVSSLHTEPLAQATRQSRAPERGALPCPCYELYLCHLCGSADQPMNRLDFSLFSNLLSNSWPGQQIGVGNNPVARPGAPPGSHLAVALLGSPEPPTSLRSEEHWTPRC